MANSPLLNPTTAAATSNSFALDSSGIPLACLSSGTFETNENAILQIYDPIAQVWTNVLINSDTPTLDENNNYINLANMSGSFRWSKTVTTNAVGISQITNGQILGSG